MIKDLNKSRFYQRLCTFKEDDVIQLRLDVKRVVDSAQQIADQVVRFLPQFTDHARQHLFNVLSYMEHIAGENNINKMQPLELALAILAAFTHDLGMALSAEEIENIAEPTLNEPATLSWLAYLGEHELADRINGIQVLAKAENRPLNADEEKWRSALIGQIKADYIRASHANEDIKSGYNRISEWLNAITKSHSIKPTYLGFAFLTPLSWLGISHGQSIYWLEDRLIRGSDGFRVPRSDLRQHRISGDETVDWLYLSWLLRISDIMDFDASRTPLILFDHAGIANPNSRVEWLKHRMIPTPPAFNAGLDRQTILYICPSCKSPEVEKAIHQTLSWINAELDNIRQKQLQTPSKILEIALPHKAEVEIKKRENDYIFYDVEFRLARDAVLELLMGEALYGEPAVALRELVQNALDAIHLRDMRTQLLKALRANGGEIHLPQPVDPVLNEDLHVSVTWGKSMNADRTGLFIRITDNGVGMTLEVILRFLTQIGKSYYRSEGFRQEKSLMEQHGILCTTISQFGIGFLSSFMIADHVTILTRSCGAEDDDIPLPDDNGVQRIQRRFPLRAEINGIHGVIGIYPDKTLKHCGTEVTLWLKKEFKFPRWHRSSVIANLGRKFYGDLWPYFNLQEMNEALNRTSSSDDDATNNSENDKEPDDIEQQKKEVDPAFEVASHIVWPLYPIRIQPPKQDSLNFVIDDKFHFRELVPINQKKFSVLAKQWGIKPDLHPHLQTYDWRDLQVRGLGTGSRVRLAVATLEPKAETSLQAAENQTNSNVNQAILNMIIEPQLPQREGRTFVLVNGILLTEKLADDISDIVCISAGVGAYLWIDLRGLAAPRLRADRRAVVSQQRQEVIASIKSFQREWCAALTTESIDQRWKLHATHFHSMEPMELIKCKTPTASTSAVQIADNWLSTLRISAAFVQLLETTKQEVYRKQEGRDGVFIRALQNARNREPSGYSVSKFDGHHRHTMAHGDRYSFEAVQTLIPKFVLDLKIACDLAMMVACAHAVDSTWVGCKTQFNLSRSQMFKDVLALRNVPSVDESTYNPSQLLALMVQTQWLNEALWPTLGEAFSLIAIEGDFRRMSDMFLSGPLRLDSLSGQYPDWLLHYHICAPLTAIPLPELRAACTAWTDQRWMRAVFMLPFAFGAVPWREESDLLNPESADKISKFLRDSLGLDTLMLFVPPPDMWGSNFGEQTREKWSEGSFTVLWHLLTGDVLYADGIHTKIEMLPGPNGEGVGLSRSNWFKQSKLPDLKLP